MFIAGLGNVLRSFKKLLCIGLVFVIILLLAVVITVFFDTAIRGNCIYEAKKRQ